MAYGKTNAGGGGGGGELHGCTIVAITNREDCIGLPATLSFNGAVIQTKLIGSDLSIVFDAVQTDGEYTISAENVEGDAVSVNVTVTARNILDTDTVTVAVDLNSQLVNYTMLLDTTSGALDECIDITGGYGAYAYQTNDSWAQHSANRLKVPTITRNNSGITASLYGIYDQYTYGSVFSENPFDITDYVGVACVTSGIINHGNGSQWGHIQIGLADNKANQYTSIAIRVLSQSEAKTLNLAKELIAKDISELSGLHYLAILLKPEQNSTNAVAELNCYNCCIYKHDEWDELQTILGISSETMTDFITNHSDELLTNEMAVTYMLRKCTGDFMVSAVSNQYFIGALGTSPFEDIVWENEHWSKFLRMANASNSKDRVYLYKDGDECVDITGGWTKVVRQNTSRDCYIPVKLEDRIQTDTSAYAEEGGYAGRLGVVNSIDFTPYNKLCVEYTNDRTVTAGWYVIQAFSSSSSDWDTLGNSQQIFSSGAVDFSSVHDTKTIRIIDISNANASGYLSLLQYRNRKADIYRIWLEK